MEFCAATNNANKLKEIKRILEKMGHTVKSSKELGIFIEPEETGITFEENAIIKAKEIANASNVATIADDSGISVNILNGEPGVYSARYSGVNCDDEANNDKLLNAILGKEKNDRGCKFTSAVCLYMPNGNSLVVQGECFGTVSDKRVGSNGFGYDSIFIPNKVGVTKDTFRDNVEQRTYAQLADNEKDAISHRGAALRKLEIQLSDFLNN